MKTLFSTSVVILACVCPLVMPQLEGPSTSNDSEAETPSTTPVPSIVPETNSEINENMNPSTVPAEQEVTTIIPSSSRMVDTSSTEIEVPDTPPPNVNNEMESHSISNESSNSSTLSTSLSPIEDHSNITERTILSTSVFSESTVHTTESTIVTSTESVVETSPVTSEVTSTIASSESLSTKQPEDVTSTTGGPFVTTNLPMEVSTEENEIFTSTEIPVTTTVSTTAASDISTTENKDVPSPVPQERTKQTTTTTIATATTTLGDKSSNISTTNDVRNSTEVSTEPIITFIPDTSKTTDSVSEAQSDENNMGGCLSKAEVNTILIIAIVVGVNVLSVVVTAICVHRLVSRRLSWDPPPMHFSKKKPTGGHPLAAPRNAGINLATDTDCRAGENPATQIPIVITNEDGWCVPYSDQDKKKKNASDKKTEDTGV